MNKKDVIHLLEKIALYLEIKGENAFKVQAYRKAAKTIENDRRSLEDMPDLTTLKGIGKKTGAVIHEFLATGQSTVLNELENEIPTTLLKLLNIQGLGGKKIAKLYQELHIEDIVMLKEACSNHLVRELEGFGAKTEEKILQAIEEFGKRPERLPLAFMLPIAEEIEQFLSKIDGITRFSRGGSLRRMEETIKDLDFIIATTKPKSVASNILQFSKVKDTIAYGDTKVSLVLAYDYDVSVDFRLVCPEHFATTLHHFTGSKDHNVRMRQIAKARGEKISEYGVEINGTSKVQTFDDETVFFKHFGLPFIPPECRNGQQEIEKFTHGYVPTKLHDMKGDLHMHTTWSDGAYSILEMANEAKNKGYEYIAITDHSKFLKVAGGLDEKRLMKQQEEIWKVNEELKDFTIFSGIEMDILPDGTLDFSDDVLARLDFVIASIHSSFNQDEQTILKRLECAMNNRYVKMIAHPTGRLIGRREGYPIQLEKLVALAKETNTILECNANPHRLDLSADDLSYAAKEGVKIAINTDSHNKRMLNDMKYGVALANRAYLKTDSIVNTWDKQRLMSYLKEQK